MRRVYRDESSVPAWGYAVATLVLIGVAVWFLLFLKANLPKPEIAEVKQKVAELEPKSEKEFSFKAKDGKEIGGFVFDGKNKYAPNSKMVVFTPFIDRDDDSYIGAAMIAAKEAFGLSNLKLMKGKAESRFNSTINSNVNFWRINNFKEKFFCFPVKDTESDKIGILVVWLEKVSAEERNTLYWQTHDPDIKRANGESYKRNLMESAEEMPSPDSEPISSPYIRSASKRTPGTDVLCRSVYEKRTEKA
jgi:hypothetical protein